MPIYEYQCLDCRRRVSVFFRSMAEASDDAARCPRCEGANLRRLVSRVAVIKSGAGDSTGNYTGAGDDALLAGLEGQDPRALAGMMRQMSDETGEPLDAEMREVVDRLERGESPEAIEQSLGQSGPELGEMGADAGAGDSAAGAPAF